MKCYVLDKNENLNICNLNIEEVNESVKILIEEVCSRWQVRNLSQKNGGSLYADEISSDIDYQPLVKENIVVSDDKIVGYYGVHFNVKALVSFYGNEEKVFLGDYDLSDYSGGTGKIERGHVELVHRPDTDTNPYSGVSRFHSQEEYDDYIKWKD